VRLILIRGGGDLASGVALRLWRAGLPVVITELARPLAVRRTVSFSEAVYEGTVAIEGLVGRLTDPGAYPAVLQRGQIPVVADPDADILMDPDFSVVVDGRMLKRAPDPLKRRVQLYIGLGPGFHAGADCDAVVETHRGHALGRLYWSGTTQPDSGQPEGDQRRVLRAPVSGVVLAQTHIGAHVTEGQVVAEIKRDAAVRATSDSALTSQKIKPEFTDQEPSRPPGTPEKVPVLSPLRGVLRGLIRPGSKVAAEMKIGDIDPRDDDKLCYLVSDKALAAGGAVLEAIMTRREIRDGLFQR